MTAAEGTAVKASPRGWPWRRELKASCVGVCQVGGNAQTRRRAAHGSPTDPCLPEAGNLVTGVRHEH